MRTELEVRALLDRLREHIGEIEDQHRGTGVDPRPSLVAPTAMAEILQWVLEGVGKLKEYGLVSRGTELEDPKTKQVYVAPCDFVGEVLDWDMDGDVDDEGRPYSYGKAVIRLRNRTVRVNYTEVTLVSPVKRREDGGRDARPAGL